jgi:hypothetical protein
VVIGIPLAPERIRTDGMSGRFDAHHKSIRKGGMRMKVRIAAVFCLVSLAMLLAVTPAVSAPGGGGSCASASVSITTGTETVAPGTTIGILGRGTNCSSSKKRYTVSFSAMSDCGQKADIASSRIAFSPGQSFMFPVSYALPYNTCTGPWVATIEISDQGSVLATGTTTIIIQ